MSGSIFDELEGAARVVAVTSAPTDAQSSRIAELGREMAALDAWLIRAGELIKERAARREAIARHDLVDAMDAVGQDRMGLAEFDVDIVVSNYYKASLPKPDDKDEPDAAQKKLELRERGLEWLGENAEGIVNTTVEVTMPKGSLPLALKMQEVIRELFSADADETTRLVTTTELSEWIRQQNSTTTVDPSSVSVDEGVHWATLTSFVREQTELRAAGKDALDLPLDALGAEVGRIAKLVRRKKAK